MAKYSLDFEIPLKNIEEKIEVIRATGIKTGVDVSRNIAQLESKLIKKQKSIYSKLSRWDRIQIARHPKRPHSLDYIKNMSTDFFELHGDRKFLDDRALITGISEIDGISIMIIGQQKGRGTKGNLYHNFGMSHPEGYRKALRVMKLAEKFNIPILTLIDTPGAHPGVGAEERGQSEAIAKNLFEMTMLKVPIINVVIGEGASGGALGIGIGDRLFCLENTWFSVISPEGCASILFRDAAKAEQAANSMKVTAQDLMEMKIADKIIPEPIGGAHHDPKQTAQDLKTIVIKEFSVLKKFSNDELINQRIKKYESIGEWKEV